MKWVAAALLSVVAVAAQAPPGAAYFLLSLDDPLERQKATTIAAAIRGWGSISLADNNALGSPAPFFRLGRTLPNGDSQIERIAVDEYIAQVLAGEGQPKAVDSAQQALAITARTFAVANRNRHRAEGFDLCDTTHCQVLRPATAVTRRAAQATTGRVLLHQGQPAFVFYSSW